jgi:glycosyltransferase involved in cell wall biosynthesis
MKVLFITKNFPPKVCGVGDYTYLLSSQFSLDNHDVFVMTETELEENGNSKFPQKRIVTSFNIKNILSGINKVKPDYIIFQYVPYSFSKFGTPFWLIVLFLSIRAKGYKIATTFHEVALRRRFSKTKTLPVQVFQRVIATSLTILSNRNITSMDYFVRELSFFKKDVKKIPIGSNINVNNLSDDIITDFRKVIGSSEEFILTSFGNHEHEKLVDVLNLLTQSGQLVKLVLLGNLPERILVPLKKKIESLNLTERVVLTGYLPEKEIFLYLKCTDLYVMLEIVNKYGEGGISSKSGSLAAAFSAGLPILGTKGDLTDEQLYRDNDNIFLVSDYSAESIGERVISIINDKKLRRSVGENSYLTYTKTLSWNSIYKSYQKALLQ